ncbi:MAG TPA: hypothetical protein VHN11_21070 [Xanthobacteraceae bacterium]|jgi:hypothetical protein|nr:hypothetical protein [Xanthobacteraceae bacterium]
MAISLVTGGALSAVANNGGNPSITLPTMAQGDVVIAFGGGPFRSGYTPGASSAGYTQISINNTSGAAFWIGRKVMGASPDATFVGLGSGNSADATAYAVYVLRGVSASIVDATTTTAGPTTSTNPDAPSIDTVTDGAWVLALALSVVNDTSITAPIGYSNAIANNQTDTNPATIGGATITRATAGTENPPSWTNWSSGVWCAATVAIRSAIQLSSITETLTLSESSSATAILSDRVTETLSPADSSTPITAYRDSVSETAIPFDSPSASAVFSASASETLTPNDSPSASGRFPSSVIESASPSDAANAAGTFPASIGESIAPSESSGAIKIVSEGITEALSPAELSEAEVTSGHHGICGLFLLQNGEPLLLEGNLGPLRLTPAPTPGLPILLQSGEPLLLECDAMGALLYTHEIPVPPVPPPPEPESLKATTYGLGGAFVRWDSIPISTPTKFWEVQDAAAIFSAEFSFSAEAEVIHGARAAIVIETRWEAEVVRTVNAQAEISGQICLDAAPHAVSSETLQRELEDDEELAILLSEL